MLIQLSDENIKLQTENFKKELAKGSKAALMFDDFMKTTLTSLYADVPFPEEVRLPKPLMEMLKGDFEPSEIIKMEPPEIDGVPIWRGSTLKDNGVVLRGAGYVNGDSRKPCYIALDDNVPHGLLAGATGHGKSVTLNSVIMMNCLEYAPWEVQFALVDAKIVEMKAYGVNSIIPHIASIAATSDAEFIISVLEDAYNIMMLRNSVFTKAGTKNIKSFREKTGLSMPHIMIAMDEFQTMFANAKKKSKFINDLITKVARLGRNTGVHLLLASQELGSDLDKSVMGNIGTRLCLGCLPNTSTQILGNDEAKINYKQKGRLIINNNPAKDDNRDENVQLRTPFLPDVQIGENKTIFKYMELLETIGGVTKPTPFHNLAFYDEEARWEETEYASYLQGRSNPYQLYLGEPSFVLKNDDGEKWLRLELKPDLNQNILVLTAMLKNRERFLKMIMLNLAAARTAGYTFGVNVIYSNKELFKSVDLGLATSTTYTREYTSELENTLNVMFWRRALIECDELAFGTSKLDQYSDIVAVVKPVCIQNGFTSELYLRRASALVQLFVKSYGSARGLVVSGQVESIAKSICPSILAVLNQFKAKEATTTKLTIDSFDPVYMFLIEVDSLSGIGVDSKTKLVGALKKVIKESPEYKIFFIISTGTLEECTDLRTTFTHVLLDSSTTQHQSQMKLADHFPDTVDTALGVYYLATSESNRCRKFKKMIFEGEIL